MSTHLHKTLATPYRSMRQNPGPAAERRSMLRTMRAWLLTRASARERLASDLEEILIDVEQPRTERRAARLSCRAEVAVAHDELERLIARLRDPRPVRPQGVALARMLLTDAAGPLRHASPNDELYRHVRRAAHALD